MMDERELPLEPGVSDAREPLLAAAAHSKHLSGRR